MKDKEEKIEKALTNILEILELRREQTKLACTLYIGILQKKYKCKVLITTPLHYRQEYREFFVNPTWKAANKKQLLQYQYRKDNPDVKVILIGENKGLIAEIQDDAFLELLKDKNKLIFGYKK